MQYRLETVNLTAGLTGLRAYAIRGGRVVGRVNMAACTTADEIEVTKQEARDAFAANGWTEAA